MEMLKSLPPDSPEQQEYITAIQNEDGYNWGEKVISDAVGHTHESNRSKRSNKGRVNMPLDSGAREMASILERWDLWESSKGNGMLLFDNVNNIHHLCSGGVLEAICISCTGYPTNKAFADFVKQFGLLVPEVLRSK
uniref:Uncharacterized protein n=1 Tax=Lactuca sativa TaxID=4236 RepID=A0A9R1X699_LACSA|nr:hypothetical protein LSAT_V11C600307350 [Lactuca sativa]